MPRLSPWFLLLLLIVVPKPLPAADPPSRKPNVLFIPIDDLNHWVRHLGRNDQAKTPHIDALAKRGITFSRAYCSAPACNPSRTALMCGLRPATTGVYLNSMDYRPNVAPDLCMNVYFRKNGYAVVGAGKIYHGGAGRKDEWDAYHHAINAESNPKGPDGVGGIKFAPLDCKDEDLVDYKDVTWCIEQLQKKHHKPFFLACGLHKPHMPWNVPQKYYDMFPLEQIKLPPIQEKDLADVPQAGIKMAGPNGDHAAMLKSGRWKEAIQGYLAAIAFADAQVGRLIEALDKSPHKDNTIICLWGDHGWHLGEKEHWRKFALWEEATRAPLIWVVPGVTKPGTVCEQPIEFIHIYPTLCDLCGLALPKHLEGVSLKPLLQDPKAKWNQPVITTHGFQNHTVRTERWRYIRYADGSEELYDHSKDEYEWTNLAQRTEMTEVKKELAKLLPAKDAKPAAEELPKKKKNKN